MKKSSEEIVLPACGSTFREGFSHYDEDPICYCGDPGFGCHCDTSGYYRNETKTILVPVRITYHPPTTLISYEQPSSDDIQKAIISDQGRRNQLIEIKSRVALALAASDKTDSLSYRSLREAAELLSTIPT
jgi:hypothetical protein